MTSRFRSPRRLEPGVSGIVRPSVLAALRLITNWKVVGSITGRSAGFSLFKIRPT